MHDLLIHDSIFKCQYVKKMAYQWHLYSVASDIYIDQAVSWLSDLNLAESF